MWILRLLEIFSIRLDAISMKINFRHLRDLYEKNELTSVINRVVEDINHRFTLEVLAQDFKSHDLGISQSHKKCSYICIC